MGVVNVTPDSFHEGARRPRPEDAAELALRLEAEGAGLIDLGAESTRPGAEDVGAAEELRRLLPVLELLKGRLKVPLSIDTRKAEVARAAFERGAAVLNDVSAFRSDPGLADFAAGKGCPVILMHMQGAPKTMQSAPRYADVKAEVRAFLAERLEFFVRRGGRAEQAAVDPGLGFGKDLDHNLELLRGLKDLKSLAPVVVGASRKSFLGRLLAGRDGRSAPSEALPPPPERYEASLAAALFAASRGADILRVHDVLGTRRALEAWSGLEGRA